MSTRILRLPKLRERGIDYTMKHLRELEAAGRFPRRIQLGPNSVGWVDDEIEAWVRARIRASRGHEVQGVVAAAEARTADLVARAEPSEQERERFVATARLFEPRVSR